MVPAHSIDGRVRAADAPGTVPVPKREISARPRTSPRPPPESKAQISLEPISPELVIVDPELARAERVRLLERARVAAIVDAEARRLAVRSAPRSESNGESQSKAQISPEPISPELVLVDPELARAERVRLLERARVAAIVDAEGRRLAVRSAPRSEANGESQLERERPIVDAEALRLAVESALRSERDGGSELVRERVSTTAPRYRRRVLQGAVLLGLLASGVLLAVVVARNGQGTPRAAFTAPTSPTQAFSPSVLSNIPSRGIVATGSTAPLSRAPGAVRPPPLPASPSETALERHIFALIISAPRAKLPPDLIDPTTGLPKNNLQVVCRGARTPHSFLCVIRRSGNGRGKLLVRYRAAKGGGGVLTWVGGT